MKNTSNAAPNLRIRFPYLLNIFKKKRPNNSDKYISL